jgi:hypothetical protein
VERNNKDIFKLIGKLFILFENKKNEAIRLNNIKISVLVALVEPASALNGVG